MEPRQPRKPGPAKKYQRRVTLYTDDAGLDLIDQLADRLNLKMAELLRSLVEEKAQSLGIQPG